MTEQRLTATQYLDHPDYGPVSRSLRFSLDLNEKQKPPQGKAIQAALISKGNLEDTLCEGEYEELVKILALEYPLSFKVWLDRVIHSLNRLLSINKILADENEFPEALEPYFKSRLKEKKLDISFVWIPNP